MSKLRSDHLVDCPPTASLARDRLPVRLRERVGADDGASRLLRRGAIRAVDGEREPCRANGHRQTEEPAILDIAVHDEGFVHDPGLTSAERTSGCGTTVVMAATGAA